MIPQPKNEIERWCKDNNLSNDIFIQLDKESIQTIEEIYTVNINPFNQFDLLFEKLSLGDKARFEIALSKLKYQNKNICHCKTKWLIFLSSILLFILLLLVIFYEKFPL